MTHNLFVNEVFGPTLQGEGPSLGRPAVFLRLAGCNLHCSWCDTKYTWDWANYDKAVEVHPMTPDDVAVELVAHRPAGDQPLLVVSGGEPMLQQAALGDLANRLNGYFRIEVETAGTMAPTDPQWDGWVSRYVVSPKLAHSGNDPAKALRTGALRAFAERARMFGGVAFKFVCAEPADLDEVAALINVAGLDGAPVYIMPEGTDPATLSTRLADLADAVIARGWYLTPRLHIALWGQKRGV